MWRDAAGAPTGPRERRRLSHALERGRQGRRPGRREAAAPQPLRPGRVRPRRRCCARSAADFAGPVVIGEDLAHGRCATPGGQLRPADARTWVRLRSHVPPGMGCPAAERGDQGAEQHDQAERRRAGRSARRGRRSAAGPPGSRGSRPCRPRRSQRSAAGPGSGPRTRAPPERRRRGRRRPARSPRPRASGVADQQRQREAASRRARRRPGPPDRRPGARPAGRR